MQFGPGHQIQRRLKGRELKSGSNIHEQECGLDLVLKQLFFKVLVWTFPTGRQGNCPGTGGRAIHPVLMLYNEHIRSAGGQAFRHLGPS